MSAGDEWLLVGGLPFAKAAATCLASTAPALPPATHKSRKCFLQSFLSIAGNVIRCYFACPSACKPVSNRLFAPETYITCYVADLHGQMLII